MINNEILSFIKEQLAQGTTKDKVKDMLVGQGGWDDKDVEEAFETINFSGTSYPSVLKNAEALAIQEEEKDKNSKDAFAPASELMNAVSSTVRPPIFSPGLSHVEQPKSMEPSISNSSLPSNTPPSLRMSTEPVKTVSGNSQLSNATTNNTESNALAGLRARIASGVSAPAPVSESVSVFKPTIQPVIKEPVVSPSSYPQPSVAASGSFSAPPVSDVPATGIENGIALHQPSPSHGMGQGGFSSLPSLKTPMHSVMSEPKISPQPLQPMAVFPQAHFNAIGNSRMSPTPAQLAALQGQKRKGGKFLLGLMMLLIGIILGGISMNAYMKGYMNTPAVNGIIEKGMNMIGLGTVTSSPSGAASTSKKDPTTSPDTSETAPDTAS